ncbi:hypothetical protein V499_07908 [Pseudogymnoascus sp. VKM F-103]|uniref:Uncharacterized protein n=1 Tax=Pseudogymnoascus verrucosus TaxID=342668 RepID=A0A1B8GUF8_9PEZI|nr:uncharacterized protein VE01_02927 [Pseudogymnoascus verrucosus]KFY71936.1 hypothetical protein V499_07908 [Pseudogymnoascus sp. VKM F-103]OBT99461.1 hypothetical protein VE01_02927 [Pseudogymnoascus verrucosus]
MIANSQLEQASIEVKRIAEQAAAELEKGTAGFSRDAGKLEGEVEEFLGGVEFVDVAGLGGDGQIVGEVLRKRIREHEEEKSKGPMLELIELFDEYSGYLDDVMVLKGE